MPAPATNDDLFALIAKSGVLDDARVKAYLDKLAAGEGVPSDPIQLGGLMVRDGLLTHFQAEQLLQGRWKRFQIGKYRVLERLGVGGMGQVFLCEHKLMKRKVAVKVLPAAKAKDEAALRRFYREARAVAAVDHPNIVRAYDIDDDDDLHFLVMEYVDGANLHDLVRKGGPMAPLRACHYIYAAAVGLQHAHENGLVHRDIKPANVLVDRGGVVKILDMGLARFFHPDDDDHLTKKFDENVLGTADYLAPEQAMDSTAVDIRADIYGLGGTFYYLLTGQPPFPDGTVAQKLLWHQNKPPKPITDYRHDVPPQLLAVVSKMLAKEPADRYQTPAEVMAALAGWVQTPIPPPAEHELPRVSVAAGGKGAGGSAAPPLVSVTHTAPPSAPHARAVPVAPRAVAVAPPPPPANPWADLHNEETIPTAQETAGPQRDRRDSPGRSGHRKKDDAPPAPRPKKPSPVLWIALAVGLGVLLVGGAAVAAVFFFAKKPDPTTAEPPAADRTVWYVSKDGDGPNPATTRRTLGEVLAVLKSGQDVTLLDDTTDIGPVPLNSLKDVRIAAPAGKTATCVYQPPPTLRQPPPAVFHLRNCEGVTLAGLVIDANGHEAGVQVSGTAHGVTLDGVTVRNAKRVGLTLLNVAAEPARPLAVSGGRFVLPAGAEAGVSVVGDVSCRGVRITGNRFEGLGAGSGVRLEGAITDTEVRNNRLFNLDAGVLFAATVPPVARGCKVVVERNTVHTAKVGVKLDAPAAADRAVTLNRNYFAAVGEAATAADPKGLTAAANGRDAATKPGVSGAAEVPGVTVPPPAADAPSDQFLRPTGKLTLADGPVGAG